MSLLQHPFKEGILGILRQHFEDRIVRNFILIFEGQTYDKYANKNIWKQLNDNCPILEVRYNLGNGITEYICDVYPWASKAATEHHLLQFITDKVKAGKIGKGWIDNKGKIGVSNIVLDGTYETTE